ncbi:P-loop containing nucleoside triphosphate hydrolase protein [Trichoderma chlorosporum]
MASNTMEGKDLGQSLNPPDLRDSNPPSSPPISSGMSEAKPKFPMPPVSSGMSEAKPELPMPPVSSGTSEAKSELSMLKSDDIVIAVMGITGAGKSTFISHFAPDAKVGHDLQSCTFKIGIHAATIGDKQCYLIDTPGFDDTTRSDTDILREVADWLNRSYQQQVRLAGIVYLHRIIDIRMGGAAMKNLRMFRKLCGDDGLSCVVLATTMWNMVPLEDGEKRERELSTNQGFWAGMVNKGSTVLRQDNGAISALAIMEHILTRKQRVELDIQKEMASGKTLDQTSAGQEVQAEMAALKEKYDKEMALLREEMKEAVEARDTAAQDEINQVRAQLEERLQRDAEDRERMRVNMEQLQAQRDKELQQQREEARQREEAHRREMAQQKQMMEAQLRMAQARNESEAGMMKMQIELTKAAEAEKTKRAEAEAQAQLSIAQARQESEAENLRLRLQLANQATQDEKERRQEAAEAEKTRRLEAEAQAQLNLAQLRLASEADNLKLRLQLADKETQAEREKREEAERRESKKGLFKRVFRI